MGEVLRPEACALGGLGSEDEHARRLRDASGELQRQGSSMHTESGGVVSSSVYLRVCVVYLRPCIFGVSSVYLRVYLRFSAWPESEALASRARPLLMRSPLGARASANTLARCARGAGPFGSISNICARQTGAPSRIRDAYSSPVCTCALAGAEPFAGTRLRSVLGLRALEVKLALGRTDPVRSAE